MTTKPFILVLAMTLTLLALPNGSCGQTAAIITTLHTFTGPDGMSPQTVLVQGRDGNFYGTTPSGGSSGNGAVFKLTPAGGFASLYSFGTLDANEHNADGANPLAALVQGNDGNFYGTTEYGGGNGTGTIFSVTSAGVLNTLRTFSVLDPAGENGDGANPAAGLVQGSDGNFYGTTYNGGSNGKGTIFKVTTAGFLTTLHPFAADSTDGHNPAAALVQGSDGNFHGTTEYGGSSGTGTVFSITPAGALTILHNFSAPADRETGENSDGTYPFSALVQGSDGNFYGTTYYGGNGGGAIFSITPQGQFTTLHKSGPEHDDAGAPNALAQGGDGNFYGTAARSDDNLEGAIFMMTPAGVITDLHDFGNGNDGIYPTAPLVLGSDGNFYGTTLYTNLNGGDGNVFKLILLPTITSPATATAMTGQAFSYQITAAFGPTSYSVQGLPAGLTVNADTGLISGTPNNGGTYALTLTAYNAAGSGSATLTLTVLSDAPTVTSATTATAYVGTAFSYQITATKSPTSYGAAGLPAGLKVNTSTGLISGTPTATGTSPVKLSATNAKGTGTATLTVAFPVPAITSSTTATAYVGQPFSLQITATANPTHFGATSLPAGLTVNASTGLISGTPTATSNSAVTLSASNGNSTATATLTLTFPVQAITSTTLAFAYLGQPFSYQITASSNPTGYGASGLPAGLTVNTSTGLISGTTSVQGTNIMVTLTASNGNGFGEGTLSLTAEPLPAPSITTSATATAYVGQPFSLAITATANPTSFGAQNLPAGLMVNTTTGLISGVPMATGTSSVLLSATNSVGTGTASLGLNVVLPPAPAINSPAAATGYDGAAFSYQLAATNHPTGFGAANLPAGLSVDASTGLISGKPTAATGTYNVSLSATNAGGTGNAPLSVTIQPGAPVITSATTATATTGSAFTYQITATNSPTKYGESGIPAGLSINQTTGKISGTPTTPGTYPVTIAAFNAAGSGSAKLTFTVKAAAPAITSALTATASEGTAFSYQITAANSPTKYGESGIPAGLSINQTTGKISGTPTTPGTYTVTIAAFNAAGSGSAKLTLTVKAAAPKITSSLSASATVGKAFSYQITATNSPTKYGESGLPAGLTIDQTSGKINGTPTKAGTYTVTIAAFNATGSGSAKLALTVQ